jgi:hypothetical protein
MAIQMRCPKCGSKIQVNEEYAGTRANCPVCWDPVRVPYVSILESVPPGDGQRLSSPKPLEPVGGLIFETLKSGILHPNRYFVAGLLICLGLMFVMCGGLGTVRNLLSPSERKVAPTKNDFDEPVQLREMSSDLDELKPKDSGARNRK